MLVPADTPVTTPVGAMVATLVVPLFQVPPAGVPVRAVDEPSHTESVPVIGLGSGVTVTTVLLLQPEPNAYVTAAVPAVIPVATPVVASIVMLPLGVLHVPPAGVALRVVLLPIHAVSVPLIVPGAALTVTTAEVLQPPAVYTTVAVPGATPPIKPGLSIVAIVVGVIDHVPPVVVVVSVVVRPTHSVRLPVMGAGVGFTVTILVVVQPPTEAAVIVAVPGAMPVTIPVPDTVATAALLVLHATGAVVVLRVVVLPTHTVAVPVIAVGTGVTVAIAVVIHPPVEV
jgi:hypothetical protein